MKVSCRKAFTETLLLHARKNSNIMALTTDSSGSVTLGEYIKELPEQYVELGIAEQNAVTVGAGLATDGKNVFVCGPACFLAARSFEQLKIDVAYNKTNVKIIGVSAGVSYGPLGGTHTALHDIAGARALPNLHIYVPSDAVQTSFLTNYLCETDEPAYLRMGRSDVEAVYSEKDIFEIGKAKTVIEGKDLTIIACGEMVYPAKHAAEQLREQGVQVRLLDLFCLKPFDRDAIIRAAEETGAILTVEEHSINGGLGELVAHTVAEHCAVPMKIMGFPDEEILVGQSAELFQHYGFTAEKITRAAVELMGRK